MIVLLTALALSAAQAPAPAPAKPGRRPVPALTSCRLVAPNGAVIGFDMATRQQDGAQQIRLKPLDGSPWPAAATDYLPASAFPAGPPAYFVDGATMIELEPFYTDHDYFFVEILQKRGENRGLTLAEGYCSDAPSRPLAAASRPVAAPLFTNPDSWDKECWVIGRDGRRSKLRYSQSARGSLTLEPLDKEIWSGAPMTVARSQPPSFDRDGIGNIFGFALRDNPDGLPSLYDIIRYETEGGTATIALRFFRMASTAPVGEDAGFGICGLRGLRRGE